MADIKPQLTDRRPLVYIVGLSAKPHCEHLAPETQTGHIVEQIAQCLPSVRIVKTNLVKTPPIDEQGRLRYPNQNEMQLGWNELQDELYRTAPNLLVTLGQQVSSFLRFQMGVQPTKPHLPSDFSCESYLLQSASCILSVHHPSFVYVYCRKDVDNYVANVVLSISSLVFKSGRNAETWNTKASWNSPTRSCDRSPSAMLHGRVQPLDGLIDDLPASQRAAVQVRIECCDTPRDTWTVVKCRGSGVLSARSANLYCFASQLGFHTPCL